MELIGYLKLIILVVSFRGFKLLGKITLFADMCNIVKPRVLLVCQYVDYPACAKLRMCS